MSIIDIYPYLFVIGALFWFWMMFDCIKNESYSTGEVIIWLVIMILGNIVGALLYFFLRKVPRAKAT